MRYKITQTTSGQKQNSQWKSQRLDPEPGLAPELRLDPTRTFQELKGFGGAFTEAAAHTFSRLSPEKQDAVLGAYFDPISGLGYNVGRIPIHSCDFSLGNYTYVDDRDESLASFSLAHEEKWLFPFLRRAEERRGASIPLLASPWSPPAWMKDNGSMNHGGKLLPQYFGLWARYLATYLRNMRDLGFDMWAVSVQNEPAATQTWDSCIYSAEEERDFVRDHLGPTLERAGLSDIKIIIWDHNRDIMVERSRTVLSDPEAAKFVWGVGIHWYGGEKFENSSTVVEEFPQAHIFFTEGCQEGGVHLGSWKTGERYARNMIGDFNNFCEGYLDWNLLLDETGGPNHVGNLCDAPIIGDTKQDLLHFNSSFYYIGQFSRHIHPGARRIGIGPTSSVPPSVPTTAFRNPDGSLVSVSLNETDDPARLDIGPEGGVVRLNLEPHSIATVCWEVAQ